MNKQQMPEPNRMIKIDCGSYSCVGKWVPYKKTKNGRFMVKKYGLYWEPDMDSWHDRESWEYINE